MKSRKEQELDIEKKIELWQVVSTCIRMTQVPVERKDSSSFKDKGHLFVLWSSVPLLTTLPLNLWWIHGSSCLILIPQHLCPLDCPSWIFLDLLALADWCLHGNKEWGGRHGGSLVHLSSIATVLFCLVRALSWVLEKAKRSKEIQLKDGSAQRDGVRGRTQGN